MTYDEATSQELGIRNAGEGRATFLESFDDDFRRADGANVLNGDVLNEERLGLLLDGLELNEIIGITGLSWTSYIGGNDF